MSKLNEWISQGIDNRFKSQGYGMARYCHGIPASYFYRTKR